MTLGVSADGSQHMRNQRSCQRKPTQLLHLGLVALAVTDRLLGSLAELDGLLDRLVPAITLNVAVGLEAVLVTADLEGELVGRGLLEVGGVVESNDTSRLGAVALALLVEVQEAVAGLAGPGGHGVGDLGLLATEVEAKVLGSDGGVVEPELLLGESELPVRLLAGELFTSFCFRNTHFNRPGAL